MLALAGFVGGFAVGLTGMGGGALMTPALVLLFKVDPKVAVASDLVNSLVMKPIGGTVHVRRGTIHWRLVALMAAGSVPAAFFGAFVLNQFGDSKAVQADIKALLGWALLVASMAIIAKAVLTVRENRRLTALGLQPNLEPHSIKPASTLLVGVTGGFIVGMTSVGSGSLMIVMLLFLYPAIGANQLVGTDLTQAVPLTLAAALGALVFGHVEFGLTASLILGSVPAVFVGSLLSSTVPDRYVRPAIGFVIFASGLKYVGLNTTALGWTLCAVLLAAAVAWLVFARPWRAAQARAQAVVTPLQSEAETPELVTQQRP